MELRTFSASSRLSMETFYLLLARPSSDCRRPRKSVQPPGAPGRQPDSGQRLPNKQICKHAKKKGSAQGPNHCV